MDKAYFIFYYIYLFILFATGITALVFQFIDDTRNRANNPLEPWRLKWSDAFLIGWGVLMAVFALSIAVGELARRAADYGLQFVVQVVGWQGGLLLLLLALVSFYPKQFNLVLSPQKPGVWRVLSQSVVQLLAAFVLFFPIAICWNSILIAVKDAGLGDYTEKQELVSLLSENPDLPVSSLLTLLIVAVVIAPIAEELLFRGLLYRFLKGRISARWAMVTSSILFGAIHLNMASFIPLTFLGMILVRAYERTGNLKVPILIHALFNANATLLALLLPYVQPMIDSIS